MSKDSARAGRVTDTASKSVNPVASNLASNSTGTDVNLSVRDRNYMVCSVRFERAHRTLTC